VVTIVVTVHNCEHHTCIYSDPLKYPWLETEARRRKLY